MGRGGWRIGLRCPIGVGNSLQLLRQNVLCDVILPGKACGSAESERWETRKRSSKINNSFKVLWLPMDFNTGNMLQAQDKTSTGVQPAFARDPEICPPQWLWAAQSRPPPSAAWGCLCPRSRQAISTATTQPQTLSGLSDALTQPQFLAVAYWTTSISTTPAGGISWGDGGNPSEQISLDLGELIAFEIQHGTQRGGTAATLWIVEQWQLWAYIDMEVLFEGKSVSPCSISCFRTSCILFSTGTETWYWTLSCLELRHWPKSPSGRSEAAQRGRGTFSQRKQKSASCSVLEREQVR